MTTKKFKQELKRQNMKTISNRQRRSERLSENEVRAFNTYVKSFPTLIDCADELGISRQSLDRIISKCSGKPSTIQKIRQHIAAA